MKNIEGYRIFLLNIIFISAVRSLDLKIIPEYFMEAGKSGHCGSTVQATNAYIRSHAGIKLGSGIIPYSNNENCTINYTAQTGSSLLIVFKTFELEDSSCNDSLSVAEDGTEVRKFCTGGDSAETFETAGSSIELQFVTNGAEQNAGFTALVTAFRNDTTCNLDEFKCDKTRCIDALLKCNGVENCVDGTDETEENAGCTTMDKILGLIGGLGQRGVLAIIILLSCIVFVCFSGIMLYQGFVKEPIEGPPKP